MKKILAIALALVMVLGLASSALAVSWAAPATSSAASPFAIEVVKLGVNADVTGAKYYTVLTDAAAYNYSNIYFAIKLSVPSYANANSYYGNSGFLSGSKVKVTVTYTNVSGKSSETYYVQLTDAAQTLWYNGAGFDAAWTSSINNNCGCGDKHILNAVAVGNKEITIKACVGASGELKDIKIDGCYSVAEKTFYGVVPCINCSPVNLGGFLFTGDCAAYGIFFSTNAAGKVTGAYVVDKCQGETRYGAALVNFDKALYGWAATDTYSNCAGSCGQIKYDLVQLPQGAAIKNTFASWTNDREHSAEFAAWLADDSAKHSVKKDASGTASLWSDVFYKNDDGKFVKVTKWEDIAPSTAPTGTTIDWYWGEKVGTLAPAEAVIANWTVDNKLFELKGYKYVGEDLQYLKTKFLKATSSDSRLYKQTSATTINCDTNEASYLNALNHMYALLGFTYADVAAGNVYMNKDILLANFGFSTSVCDTKTWGAYTAAITVATVAEVPATGSVTYVGFAMIVLAIAAAVVTKKVRA